MACTIGDQKLSPPLAFLGRRGGIGCRAPQGQTPNGDGTSFIFELAGPTPDSSRSDPGEGWGGEDLPVMQGISVSLWSSGGVDHYPYLWVLVLFFAFLLFDHRP